MDDLAAALAERNAAFEADDLSWAIKTLPNASHPSVVVMAFHKSRFECVSVSEQKRPKSRTWLADRGLTTLAGDPVRHDDPLPV